MTTVPPRAPTAPVTPTWRTQQRQVRRSGQIEAALSQANRYVAALPDDRRAWARLAHAALRAQRPQIADRALARLSELAIAHGFGRAAVRVLLRRAALLAGSGSGSEGESLVARALELAVRFGDTVGVYLARQALAVLAVRRGDAGCQETLSAFLRTAVEAGREAQALGLVSQLAMGEGFGAGTAARLLGARARAHDELDVAARWFIEALRRLPVDAGLENELEQLAFSAGLWGELGALYRLRAERSSGAARALALEQLAELWEDELQNPQAALDAYRAALEASGGSGARGALREFLRLSALMGTLGAAAELLRSEVAGPVAENVTLLEQLAQGDLPPSARLRVLETFAVLVRDDLKDPPRAEAALARAETMRKRAQ